MAEIFLKPLIKILKNKNKAIRIEIFLLAMARVEN